MAGLLYGPSRVSNTSDPADFATAGGPAHGL
jgi:hypothetical protein